MTKVHTLSVKLTPKQLKLLKQHAKKQGQKPEDTLESVLDEALQELVRREAAERVIKYLGAAANYTPAQRRKIVAEWQG